MRLKITGLREVAAKLEATTAIPSARLKRGMRKAAKVIENRAKELAPVDTGNLRKSITSKATSETTAEVFVSTKKRFLVLKNGKHYPDRPARRAHFTEFGTGTQPAQPFMRPAAEQKQGEAMKVLSQHINQEVKRG